MNHKVKGYLLRTAMEKEKDMLDVHRMIANLTTSDMMERVEWLSEYLNDEPYYSSFDKRLIFSETVSEETFEDYIANIKRNIHIDKVTKDFNQYSGKIQIKLENDWLKVNLYFPCQAEIITKEIPEEEISRTETYYICKDQKFMEEE